MLKEEFSDLVKQVINSHDFPLDVQILLEKVALLAPRLEKAVEKIRKLEKENGKLKIKLLKKTGVDKNDPISLPAKLQIWLENQDYASLTYYTMRSYLRIIYSLMACEITIGDGYVTSSNIGVLKGVEDKSKIKNFVEKYDLVREGIVLIHQDDKITPATLFKITNKYYTEPDMEEIEIFKKKFEFELASVTGGHNLPPKINSYLNNKGLYTNSRDTIVNYIESLLDLMKESEYKDQFVKSTDLKNVLGLLDGRQINRLFKNHQMIGELILQKRGLDNTSAFFYRVSDVYL